jgi:hypothetical protein
LAFAAAPVIEPRAAFRPRFLAHGGQFFGAAIAAVGVAGRKQLLGYLAVSLRARELKDDLTIPGKAKPGKTVDDRVDGGRSRALAVGILDPQQPPPMCRKPVGDGAKRVTTGSLIAAPVP